MTLHTIYYIGFRSEKLQKPRLYLRYKLGLYVIVKQPLMDYTIFSKRL